MKKYYITAFIFLLIGIGIWFFYPDTKYYESFIHKEREAKNTFMQNSEISPLKGKYSQELQYYPVDISYRILSKIHFLKTKSFIEVMSSDNNTIFFEKIAFVKFYLKGKEHRVMLLKNTDSQEYFIPFLDSTNGKETYSGGRYLPVEMKKNTQDVLLDFNKAYNPYCHYDSTYTCPIPPPENYLRANIQSGEKLYKQTH